MQDFVGLSFNNPNPCNFWLFVLLKDKVYEHNPRLLEPKYSDSSVFNFSRILASAIRNVVVR